MMPADQRRFEATIPVPGVPIDRPGPEAWSAIEGELGTALPVDYRWFVETYGTGCICEFLWILTPFTENSNLELRQMTADLSDQYSRMWPEDAPPFPFHPEPNGLLPAGITDNGDVLHWHRIASSESWPLIIANWRSGTIETHHHSLTDLILAFVGGELFSDLLPPDFVVQPFFRSEEST